MVKFIPNQIFRDGSDTFEPGEEYDEPVDRAGRFIAAGWADTEEEIEGIDPSPTPDHSTLEVQDVIQGHTDPGA